MQGIRFRVFVKSLSASCVSYNFDQFTKSPGSSETNDANKCKTQKCNIDENMKRKLIDLAMYSLNQDQRRQISRNLCDCNPLNDEKRISRDAETKEFIEDILKKYEEALHEYKSFVQTTSSQENSSDQSCGCSDHQNCCTSSTTQNIPPKKIASSGHDDGNSSDVRGSVNIEDRQNTVKVENAEKFQEEIKHGLEKFKKQADLLFFMGAITGSLVGASVMLLTFAVFK